MGSEMCIRDSRRQHHWTQVEGSTIVDPSRGVIRRTSRYHGFRVRGASYRAGDHFRLQSPEHVCRHHMTPKATQTPKHVRLCCFSPNYRSMWAILEVLEDENTLVLTDSNGKTLAVRAPANWRIAAYRGGKLADAVRVLEKCPIPSHVTTLIILHSDGH